ncbi:family 88 glycosyl hydrolase [Cylindrobasidium torrendii FP15055 ss-10]|uniref:Family 88 glycosyl hydrolase n=1 Tax=Cylindrobasidium torrendii FP15055 ss-10 TaxID=1314674 RepID=A0A0D7B8F0_9AGAR|nr:family 88 glycosyl hydrolase [Cylindrobasidium torrendii FP15055 ss-10]
MAFRSLLLTFSGLTSIVHARSSAFALDPGFDIEAVAKLAESLPSHSWEFGTACEMLMELYTPEFSVFGDAPFPAPFLDPSSNPSLTYAQKVILLDYPGAKNGLSEGDGAVGDPASMGISAYLLGKTNASYAEGARKEIQFQLDAPRWPNGAISHRQDVAELWADFGYMSPPFMAYYAAETFNTTMLDDAVRQGMYYREVLQGNDTSAPWYGVWHHIIGPQSTDLGLWTTGNGWFAAGMTRVLATVKKAPASLLLGHEWKQEAVGNLTQVIKEIVDGVVNSELVDGLVRNYIDSITEPNGFPEISGSAMIANVIYRMAVLAPETFGGEYVAWADAMRETLGGADSDGNPHVTANGTVTPAVNPLDWFDTKPYTAGSPEGQNFVVLMYAAWRDCVYAGLCSI